MLRFPLRMLGRLGWACRRACVRLAEATAQRADQLPEAETAFFLTGRALVFFALAAIGAALLVPAFQSTEGRDGEAAVELSVPLPLPSWRQAAADPIALGSGDPCAAGGKGACPANPRQKGPWLEPVPGEGRWLVRDLSAREAELARAAGANIFYLKNSGRAARLYAAGTLLMAVPGREAGPGGGRAFGAAALATIPVAWLAPGLRLAVWTEPDYDVSSLRPQSAVGGQRLGLATPGLAAQWAENASLRDDGAQFALAAAAFMLSASFLATWAAFPRRRDAFAFGSLCLALGFVALRLSAKVHFALPVYQRGRIDLILFTVLAAAALLPGLALARIRRSLGVFAMAGLAGFYAYWNLSADGAEGLAEGARIANCELVPGAYLFSILLCALQKSWLTFQIRERNSEWLRPRLASLRWHAWALAGFFFAHLLAAFAGPNGAAPPPGAQAAPLALLLLELFRLIRDATARPASLEGSRLSRFHRMSPIPQYVQGLLLDIDLKKSESLYDAAALSSDQNMLVAPFVDSWIAAVRAIGGDVIQFQGDMIRALFEMPSPTARSLSLRLLEVGAALERMNAAMPKIALEIERAHRLSVRARVGRPAFRAALSFGAVRPAFIGVGSQRISAWMNADDRQILVRMARLSDAEHEISARGQAEVGQRSTIVVDEVAISGEPLSRLLAAWAARDARVQRSQKIVLKGKGTYLSALSYVELPPTEERRARARKSAA